MARKATARKYDLGKMRATRRHKVHYLEGDTTLCGRIINYFRLPEYFNVDRRALCKRCLAKLRKDERD